MAGPFIIRSFVASAEVRHHAADARRYTGLSSGGRSLRRVAGAALLDVPPLLFALGSRDGWVGVHNRLDDVDRRRVPLSVRCLSGETSSLHVCDVFPTLGRSLLGRAASAWSFRVQRERVACERPRISFVIPHRGSDRVEQLLTTIGSIASLGDDVECIVVEQDEQATLENLPAWVRYVHAPHPTGDARWHKCFAFNRGVEHAKGEVVVCQDGDVLVPDGYRAEIDRWLFDEGLDVLYAQRFLFYLDREATGHLFSGQIEKALARRPEQVKQNWVGGTLAIKREAYWSIGGFDEGFTGWSGEDREFYDRCQLLDGWFHGYVPFLHLWHPPQSGRVSEAMVRRANDFTRARLAVPREERVARLRECSGR